MKVSTSGYKKNSKDKKEKSLVIPSNSITMNGVEHPILGIDNLGNTQLMSPGVESYLYPGDYVTEYPIKEKGGAMKKPNNAGFNHLPEYVQKHIISSMKQLGGQSDTDLDMNYDPLSQFFQLGGNSDSMTASQWNQYNQAKGYQPATNFSGNPYKEFYNPQEYFKDENGGFTKVGDKGKTVNYNNDPTYNPFIKYQGNPASTASSQYKPKVNVLDPTKQVGFNGMQTPIVEQYQTGGGIGKFVKNYVKKLSKSESPQGMSMDDYISSQNNQFVDYIAANTRNAIFKDEMGLIQDQTQNNKFQKGGPNVNFDPNYWANQEDANIQPPSNALSVDPQLPYNAPMGNNYNSFTNGPFGPYAEQSLPSYIPKQPNQQINPNWQGAGVDLNPDVMSIINNSRNSTIKNNFNSGVTSSDYADFGLNLARGVNSIFDTTESNRQARILANKETIENTVPTNYGSRGDYDVNSGVFRPNQYLQVGGGISNALDKGLEMSRRNDFPPSKLWGYNEDANWTGDIYKDIGVGVDIGNFNVGAGNFTPVKTAQPTGLINPYVSGGYNFNNGVSVGGYYSPDSKGISISKSFQTGGETSFQEWRNTLPKNLQYEGDYDLKGYYKKYGNRKINKDSHLTDEFKLPNHPSFSNESIYYNEDSMDQGGHWDNNNYVPNDPLNKKFKKGGSYELDSKTISDLISQGYNIQFID